MIVIMQILWRGAQKHSSKLLNGVKVGMVIGQLLGPYCNLSLSYFLYCFCLFVYIFCCCVLCAMGFNAKYTEVLD